MDEYDDTSPAGLYILFGRGQRPPRSTLLRAVDDIPLASVSLDPASNEAQPARDARKPGAPDGQWLELMLAGFTFDLLGLAPGPGVVTPQVSHRLACREGFDPREGEALALLPGPHLADGAKSLPIMRAMVDLGCALARRLDGATTLCWSPARTAIGTTMFCRSVDSWLSGGAFPALGLTAFAPDADGAIVSEGLDYLVGQELRFHPDFSQDRIATTKLGVRLVHEIVGTGPLAEPREFVTEQGVRLMLRPGIDTQTVEVTRM